MKPLTTTIFIIGLVLMVTGVLYDNRMAKRGDSGDVRLVAAFPVITGALLIAVDFLLIIVWGIWRLFT